MNVKSASLLIVIVVCTATAVTVWAGDERQSGTEHGPPDAIPLVMNQPIELDLKSDPVTWRDRTYHLLSFHEARFALNDAAQLTATLSGSSTTFDDIDYTVHAAVFDMNGHLLGTASTPCHVQRLWPSFVLHTQAELVLDFGRSNAYTSTAWVTFAISSMDVLTPDQWQQE